MKTLLTVSSAAIIAALAYSDVSNKAGNFIFYLFLFVMLVLVYSPEEDRDYDNTP